jgi:hypothetical protein
VETVLAFVQSLPSTSQIDWKTDKYKNKHDNLFIVCGQKLVFNDVCSKTIAV